VQTARQWGPMGPMGDQNPMAYVHKGGVRILSYLYKSLEHVHTMMASILAAVPV
jgi:hypothetical protein